MIKIDYISFENKQSKKKTNVEHMEKLANTPKAKLFCRLGIEGISENEFLKESEKY